MQNTRHICIEGWDVIGNFAGTRVDDFLAHVGAPTHRRAFSRSSARMTITSRSTWRALGTLSHCSATRCADSRSHVNGFRGRAGYGSGHYMVYGTGGIAMARVEHSFATSNVVNTFDVPSGRQNIWDFRPAWAWNCASAGAGRSAPSIDDVSTTGTNSPCA